MLGEHRVRGRADLDNDGIAVDGKDGDMLFEGRVNRAGLDLPHGLAAAHDGAALLLDDCDDLTAGLAAVEFHFHVIFLLVMDVYEKTPEKGRY